MSTVELLEELALQDRVFPEVPESQTELKDFWNNKLCAVFGSNALKLTLAIFGQEAGLKDLQKVFYLQAPLSARASEQPWLLSLLVPFVRLDTCPSDFSQVRKYYGLSASAWKALCHCPVEVVRNLAPFLKRTYCRRWVELVVKSQCVGVAHQLLLFNQGRPAGFVHYDFMLEDGLWSNAQEQLKRLFLLYGKRAQALSNKEDELLDAQNCLEALGSELYPDFLANRCCIHKNSSFESLVRTLNERWQQAARIRKASSGESVLAFPSVGFEKFESDNFEWVFISNSEALIQEGQIMRHCVGNPSYISSAAIGRSLIFSVTRRHSALTVRATVEIVRCGSGLICSQVKGPGNSSPSSKITEEVSSLIARLSEACH